MKIIYKITNDFSDLVYVGQTKNLKERIRFHKLEMKRNRHSQFLYNDMNIYGFDRFKFDIIEEVENKIADKRERYWIEYYNSFFPNGYNLTTGGTDGSKYSSLSKRKIGDSTKERWKNEDIAKRMKEGLRKSGLAQKGKMKKPRVLKMCPICDKIFATTKNDKKKFCSFKCACASNIKSATVKHMENRSKLKNQITTHALNWISENKDIIKNCEYNKIETNLKPLLDEIYKLYEIKDFRVISKSVCGKDSRKKLLKFLKDNI